MNDELVLIIIIIIIILSISYYSGINHYGFSMSL